MFGADKKYLSISINEGVIKVAQATSSGVLEKVARSQFNPTAEGDQAVSTLKSLLVSFDRKASVVCAIPANAATVKNIVFFRRDVRDFHCGGYSGIDHGAP